MIQSTASVKQGGMQWRLARAGTCAEKMAFMTAMYWLGTSGEPSMHRMRGLGLSALLEAALPCSLRTRHKARDRAADQQGAAWLWPA